MTFLGLVIGQIPRANFLDTGGGVSETDAVTSVQSEGREIDARPPARSCMTDSLDYGSTRICNNPVPLSSGQELDVDAFKIGEYPFARYP